jgi:hypothetical protein
MAAAALVIAFLIAVELLSVSSARLARDEPIFETAVRHRWLSPTLSRRVRY